MEYEGPEVCFPTLTPAQCIPSHVVFCGPIRPFAGLRLNAMSLSATTIAATGATAVATGAASAGAGAATTTAAAAAAVQLEVSWQLLSEQLPPLRDRSSSSR